MYIYTDYIRMIVQHANRHVTWLLTEVIGNLGVADIDSRLEVRVPGMNHGVQECKESGDAIFVRTVDMANIMMFLESVYIYFNTLQSCSNVFPNLISMYDQIRKIRFWVCYIFLCSYEIVYTKVPVYIQYVRYQWPSCSDSKNARLLPTVIRSKSLMASCMPSRRLTVNGPSVFCVHESSMWSSTWEFEAQIARVHSYFVQTLSNYVPLKWVSYNWNMRYLQKVVNIPNRGGTKWNSVLASRIDLIIFDQDFPKISGCHTVSVKLL